MVKGFQIAFFIANCLLLIGLNLTVSNEVQVINIENISAEVLVEDSNEFDEYDALPKNGLTIVNFSFFETSKYFEKHSPFLVSFSVHIRAPPILTV